MSFLKKIFRSGSKTDYAELMRKGAIILDVRSPGGFRNGHIEASLNIPLNSLENNLSELNKNKCIICCCASGMRSGSARNLLKSRGFSEVYNGGPWMELQNKIK